ncbi:amino acid adenylation domain-containing protein, partial [Photorhabdus noenieputensis]|nr:amino acid adenylation domain-containing protein [Photorhabdus noenieputensis]
VVGILAILKAGGAYVPLDPAYPGERLGHILHDAAPTVVLADKIGRSALGEETLARLTVLDPNTLPDQPDSNPQIPALTARNLAYVIYTSGSTGMPKGVMVEHNSLLNLHSTLTARVFAPSSASYRVSLNASMAFDASLQHILGLLNGYTLVIVPQDVRVDGAALLQFLATTELDVLDCTPMQLEMLLAAGLSNYKKALTLLIGGESISTQIWQTIAGIPQLTAYNVYGPTECTVDTTLACIEPSHPYPTIGRPLDNARLYLLDNDGYPVPLGAIGELYIGGVGVARGYLNRPDLTAERFLSDPFSDKPNARMYRTGDLARYLPDGNLEFLGRNDHQVKIRGFRIETGEIEFRLVEHPAVSESVVLAQGEGQDKRLVAYVVAENHEGLVNSLHTYLGTVLPDYMVPSAFVRLDAFPLTPNGKLDRQALPVPGNEAVARQVYEAPQGDMEMALAAIWREVLGIEQISRYDSFFALGGHSLLAVRVMNRVAALGIELPLTTLFKSPSLKAFAEVMQARKGQLDTTLPAIVPVSREGTLPLSFAQQRLWFLAQLEGVSETYHIPMALRLSGQLDIMAWQKALDTLFARHEALRSVFVSIDGQPQVRLLAPNSGLLLSQYDLRGLPDADVVLERLSVEEAHASFDLESGPLIRAALIQLTDSEYQFLLTLHHIISDGWSANVLIQELNTLYTAFIGGQSDPLPPLAIQYPDYAAWQRQWLSAERIQVQSDYWRAMLADAPVLLDLPTDRPRPPEQSFAGDTVPVNFDVELTAALKRLSEQQGVTLFMTLLSAWVVVLSRLSGQDDVVIGTPSAGRSRQEVEPLIGFFVNTLALRMDLSGELTVAELLARVRQTALAAQEHQDLPFEQVVEIVQPPRRLAHTPLFQVIFAWQNNESTDWKLPKLAVSPVDQVVDVVKFDLELGLAEEEGRIVGALNYAAALFDPSTVERQVEYLRAVLQAMVTNSQQPVGEIDILSSTERKLLLETWNATETAYPDALCIHQLFEQQVEQTPDAIALVHEEQTLSYAELNAGANRLAHQLIELGVAPDQRVAICVSRSPAIVVGILAILKAGGAYVPLDPAYPGERLGHILHDAAPTVVLADKTGRSALGEETLTRLTVLDPNALPDQPDSNPQIPALTARHLAYVIYTSGSTGMPKGVMVEHNSLLNLHSTLTARVFAPSSASYRVSLNASMAFDASLQHILGLLNGYTLVIVPQDVRVDGAALLQFLATTELDVLDCTPMQLEMLLAAGLSNHKKALTLLIGGESISTQTWQTIAGIPQLTAYNVYGPTECTVEVTLACIEPSHPYPTIGRPLDNIRLYLLDNGGYPVPLGAIGELYIGGVGVTRGYLNRPDLTAERFLSDPFSDKPDARMYRTGDLARYLPDGNLEFLGRNDHQVKIRGFRIEPGEIEARLMEHPAVSEALVLALGDGQDKRLAAYVVAEADDLLVNSLRAYLSAILPDYMVPSAFVRLDAFPLTPNGKLDRRALPAPGVEAFVHQIYEAPQGEMETVLATIWRELLGIERISRHDNFFALGGHSLLAVRMINRIAAFGIELSLTTLFKFPSLQAFAEVMQARKGQLDTILPAIVPVSREGALPLSFAQQRLWFLTQLEGVSETYHIPMALRLSGQLDIMAWQKALDTLFARHEALRSVFVSVDGQPQVRLLAPNSSLLLSQYDLRGIPDADVVLEHLSVEEAHASFDLESGPLIRAALIQLTDSEYQFLLTLHHIISDGWSFNVMIQELNTLYTAFIDGQSDPLPPLAIQYPDYAAWQRQWLSAERIQVQSDYWRATLSDAPVLLDLPTDRPRPPAQSFVGQSVPIDLDVALTTALKRLSEQQGVTLFMTLLSAWVVVLSRLSGQDDVVIGTPSAGRSRQEVEPLIGFFVNTLALRMDLSGELTVAELLARVRQTALAAQEHQDLPFEQVVEIVQPPRRLAHTPLFQVVFAWQNNESTDWKLPKLAVSPVDQAVDVVKFDLELGLSEEEGRIVGALNYATALFDPSTVERQVEYLRAVLQAMVANSQQPVGEIDILSPTERKLLLETWNATETAYPDALCIHQLFEQQVEQTPGAIALVHEEQTLSYAELNARANRLAHQLIELGVAPDQRVAICVARSPAMVVGVLAILKAGGAYVPLDPVYTGERLAHILTDAAPVILLADNAGRA